MPFYNDDGTEINPDLVPKPGLCVSCKKDDDPSEEILCILTRADQQDAAEFQCFAYAPREKQCLLDFIVKAWCGKAASRWAPLFLSFVFWEFFTPFNQFGEPIVLIGLELTFWVVIAISEALTIACVMEL